MYKPVFPWPKASASSLPFWLIRRKSPGVLGWEWLRPLSALCKTLGSMSSTEHENRNMSEWKRPLGRSSKARSSNIYGITILHALWKEGKKKKPTIYELPSMCEMIPTKERHSRRKSGGENSSPGMKSYRQIRAVSLLDRQWKHFRPGSHKPSCGMGIQIQTKSEHETKPWHGNACAGHNPEVRGHSHGGKDSEDPGPNISISPSAAGIKNVSHEATLGSNHFKN